MSDDILKPGAASGGTAMHLDRDGRQEPRYQVPAGRKTVRYDEELLIPRAVFGLIDLDRLKTAGWVPLSLQDGRARVAAVHPDDPEVALDVRRTLGAESIEFLSISAEDLAWIIANNQDVNPGFPSTAERTTLAKVRNYLANRRSLLSSRRTVFSRGRTGLAMLRTGLAVTTALLLLFRLFGFGWVSLLELALLILAGSFIVDGMRWYMPARKLSRRRLTRGLPDRAGGVAVLSVRFVDNQPVFERSAPVPGAEAMRDNWDCLSPVRRRRFLALERTDMAEERTLLAYYRTLMAKSRTGMALVRTGVALAGIGIALIRQFHHGNLDIFGWLLVALGLVMTGEGLVWYLPGRRAGRESVESTRQAEDGYNPWAVVLPPETPEPAPVGGRRRAAPRTLGRGSPGIWGTTGLALERTLLAERRNVMARLRTHMAMARTGLAFIRTGMNFMAVGLGLLVSFGLRNPAWTVVECVILSLGLFLAGDGLYWFIPADRIRKRLPYCFHDMEIAFPDYTKPQADWSKVVFAHDE